ncbi:MAG: hypothetical protein K8S87_02280 [Planctomycetes bacterium]|nr:hypothetical protein [Planctomycetota bacterium]
MKDNAIFKYSLKIFLPTALIASFVMIYLLVYHNIVLGINAAILFGLYDMVISSRILNNIEKAKDDRNDITKQYAVLVYGFFIRMIIIFAGYFGLEYLEKASGASFAITYIILHFTHIAGFSVVTMKKMNAEKSDKVEESEKMLKSDENQQTNID